MHVFRTIALAAAAGLSLAAAAAPAAAQQVIGFDPVAGPICNGPLGIAPCVVIQQWIARQQGPQGGFGAPPFIPPPGAPMPGGFPGGAPGLPPILKGPVPTSWTDAARKAGIPNDGILVAQIGQQCGPNPVCMATAWAGIEASRCANGIGVPGGCLGPNGELNKLLPHNLQPSTIINNAINDLTHGPGPNNEFCKLGLC